MSFSLFVLVYPNSESFEKAFESDQKMAVVDWENDLVLGINKSPGGIDFELFDVKFQLAYSQWLEQNKKSKHEEITL